MSRGGRHRSSLYRAHLDVMRGANNLADWLEVKEDLLRVGISARRFYACRAEWRDRVERDEDVIATFDAWRHRWN